MITKQKVFEDDFSLPISDYHNVQEFLNDFESSNHSFIKLNWKKSGYASANSMVGSLRSAIRRCSYNIRCFIRNGEVWIYKPIV